MQAFSLPVSKKTHNFALVVSDGLIVNLLCRRVCISGTLKTDAGQMRIKETSALEVSGEGVQWRL